MSSAARPTISTRARDADTTKSKDAYRPKKKLLLLAFSSIGVVYGDIGTSPLYAFASQFSGAPSKTEVLGAASVTIWLLTVILIFKYIVVVLRANDHGEGGTFALYSLLCRGIGINPLGTQDPPTADRSLAAYSFEPNGGGVASIARPRSKADPASTIPAGDPAPASYGGVSGQIKRSIQQHVWLQRLLLVIAVSATAMVLGDGVFTPSISVLSAVSGLTTLVPSITQDTIIAVTVAILVVLFCLQQFGTHKVSIAFAPVILLWFLALDGISVYRFAVHGGAAFAALNPWEIVRYFNRDTHAAWKNLANAVLVVTGAEALFADLGHFSQASISVGALVVVYPSLSLTYLSQAAYLLENPQHYSSLYWNWVPHAIQWPMLILATAATIIASQALISASFSLVSQAMKLGVFPTMTIKHTRVGHAGQIYIPEINYLLMIFCVVIVGGFRDTTKLGDAYGLTVVTVMTITTLLLALVMLLVWGWRLLAILPICGPLLALEVAMLASTLRKVPHGAWVALVLATVFTAVSLTWWYVRRLVAHSTATDATRHRRPLQTLLVPRQQAAASCTSATKGRPPASSEGQAAGRQPDDDQERLDEELVFAPTGQVVARTGGVGVYYAPSVDEVPQVLAHLLATIPALPDVLVLLTVRHPPVSNVTDSERFLVRPLVGVRNGYHVVARYGYMDQPNHDKVFVKCMLQSIAASIHLQWMDETGRSPGQEQQPDVSDQATADLSEVVVASDNAQKDAVASTSGAPSATDAGPPGQAADISSISKGSSASSGSSKGLLHGSISPAEMVLDRAWRQGVVQVVAYEAVHAGRGSGIFKQTLVNGIFPLLTPGGRRPAVALHLPPSSTLEVVLAVTV